MTSMLAPVLLIPDSTLQQTTQNETLLLLFSDISDSSAISVVAQRSRVANSGQLIQQMTQNDMLILFIANICDSSSVRCWAHDNKFNGSILIESSRDANSGQQTAADDIK
ncbi:hypothetical protein OUZ56_012516 [Daphnia magna]|uniref:Uncharacterized protein n=1 Tax=Daphnia magna TaxID=35525 RepID=A0ABQ9Z383_9CRUS|nr:hypothetical protein OUZ56_012516 [Daphnia magna]